MNYQDNYLLDSGFSTENSMVNGVSNISPNYGSMLSKYDYIQQPTSLSSASASSSFSSGSSSSSTSGSFAFTEPSSSFIPTTSPLQIKEEDYDDDTLDLFMPLPPKAKPPSSKGSGVKKSSQGGRKRSIIFEQEEAEIQRKEFLERNRIAASKCRQKKKQWMKGLESNYEKLSTQNQRLRSMVMLFQEEVNALKTELLTRNGVCSCTDMRTYYHNNNTVSTMDPRNSFTHANYVPTSQSMTMSMPTTTTLPSVSPPEPNDFLPNNTLPPLSLSLPPYLNE